MRILFTLQYLGTRYAGWQSQTNAVGVQDVVETVLAKLFGTTIRVEAAGRTDAGVHASAQKAHCDIPFAIPFRGLIRGMNDLLPRDVRALAVEEIPDDFHCRFRAKRKTYVYRIWNDEVMDVFRWETHAQARQPLDDTVMRNAAGVMLGIHDFRAFTVIEPEVSSTERTITALGVERLGQVITIRITANGFLRFMVRRMVGSLIEIGRGKLDGDALRRSLEPTFEPARWTAPPRGLTLDAIEY
jgi:tRNA pseudouridine38-40 synthase